MYGAPFIHKGSPEPAALASWPANLTHLFAEAKPRRADVGAGPRACAPLRPLRLGSTPPRRDEEQGAGAHFPPHHEAAQQRRHEQTLHPISTRQPTQDLLIDGRLVPIQGAPSSQFEMATVGSSGCAAARRTPRPRPRGGSSRRSARPTCAVSDSVASHALRVPARRVAMAPWRRGPEPPASESAPLATDSGSRSKNGRTEQFI